MFDNRLVAVLNKSIEPGVALNALGHMSLGLSASLPREDLSFATYIDNNNLSYSNISKMPFIVLKASGNKIRNLVHQARDTKVPYTCFLNTMTGGTYKEQLERTNKTPESELIYYGALLFGPVEQLTQWTGKFSLWK